jgi:pyruvate kinase
MHRDRSSKIIATLGPASATLEVVESLFLAGVDIFRLNFSHGSYLDHQSRFEKIRSIEKKYNYPIGILMDLQGPKIRIGSFEKGFISLKKNQEFSFFLDKVIGNAEGVSLPHEEVFRSLKTGCNLLLDDGRLSLEVISISESRIYTKVLVGGILSNNKGVNIPDIQLAIPSLTNKDKKDLAFGLSLGIEMVALSFIQTPEDIILARKLIKDSNVKIISKIEKPLALNHLEEISKLSDGLMVARGDLGVEIKPEEVPMAQKQILKHGNNIGCPVIVATQMLESMVKSPTPTRAEAVDVSNAVYEGADAVMLSAESASGDYPIESVSIMSRIIKNTEKSSFYRQALFNVNRKIGSSVSDAIALSACKTTETLNGKVSVTFTTSSVGAKTLSKYRPFCSIIALTTTLSLARQLSLFWGVTAVVCDNLSDSNVVKKLSKIFLEDSWGKKGDFIILIEDNSLKVNSNTSVLRVHQID